MTRLTARLWGGVSLPALESLDLRRPQNPRPKPIATYRTTPLDDEALFRSMLNSNQLKALDDWKEMNSYSSLEHVWVPVYGSIGRLWHIEIFRHKTTHPGPWKTASNPRRVTARLIDPNGTARCFHAVDSMHDSFNGTRPYLAAITFMCAIQADETEVSGRAGVA